MKLLWLPHYQSVFMLTAADYNVYILRYRILILFSDLEVSIQPDISEIYIRAKKPLAITMKS